MASRRNAASRDSGPGGRRGRGSPPSRRPARAGRPAHDLPAGPLASRRSPTSGGNVADAPADHHLLERPTRIWILRVARVIVWIIYFFVLIALVLLIIAFFLRLFGANPQSGFTE